MDRRIILVIVLTIAVNILSVHCNKTVLKTKSSTMMENPLVQTKDGQLRGFTMMTVTSRPIDAFQGIPFAEPPVGDLRFRDTVKSQPWSGTRDAVAESPECIQMDPMRKMAVVGQEDCLYLNVYRPQKSTQSSKGPLPVLVWIHGGCNTYGSATIFGPTYLLDRDIILVTVNYRLGILGFLSTGDNASPGNQGMKDQSMALRWIKENIAAFGGNPNSITIFGESTGGISVHLHMMSPLSKGLFNRAIAESGTAMAHYTLTSNPIETAKAIAEQFKCKTDSTDEMVSCLRNIEAKELLPSLLKLYQWSAFPMVHFAPVVEHKHSGAFLTETPDEAYRNKRVLPIPFITGFNKDEMVSLTSFLIQNKNVLEDINKDWDRVGPIMLDMKYNATDINVKNAGDVRKFYMGDGDFKFETRHQFTEMITDRYIVNAALLAMRYHAQYTRAPTYGYMFSYSGKYSVLQKNGVKPKEWGVAHVDELIYLLNCTLYYDTLQPGDEDFKMSQIMTGTWSNFATNGHPLVENDGKSTDIWKPIAESIDEFSPLQLLELNLNPKMIEDPVKERYTFWMKLPIPKFY